MHALIGKHSSRTVIGQPGKQTLIKAVFACKWCCISVAARVLKNMATKIEACDLRPANTGLPTQPSKPHLVTLPSMPELDVSLSSQVSPERRTEVKEEEMEDVALDEEQEQLHERRSHGQKIAGFVRSALESITRLGKAKEARASDLLVIESRLHTLRAITDVMEDVATAATYMRDDLSAFAQSHYAFRDCLLRLKKLMPSVKAPVARQASVCKFMTTYTADLVCTLEQFSTEVNSLVDKSRATLHALEAMHKECATLRKSFDSQSNEAHKRGKSATAVYNKLQATLAECIDRMDTFVKEKVCLVFKPRSLLSSTR
jgi:hypothetical protein